MHWNQNAVTLYYEAFCWEVLMIQLVGDAWRRGLCWCCCVTWRRSILHTIMSKYNTRLHLHCVFCRDQTHLFVCVTKRFVAVCEPVLLAPHCFTVPGAYVQFGEPGVIKNVKTIIPRNDSHNLRFSVAQTPPLYFWLLIWARLGGIGTMLPHASKGRGKRFHVGCEYREGAEPSICLS